MPVESAADRAAFLDAGEFGEVLAWTVGVVTTSIVGIPNTGALRLDQQDGAGMIGRHASVLVSVDDLPVSASVGNAVLFRSTAHTVKAIEPDGTGMALVRLEEIVADEEDD